MNSLPFVINYPSSHPQLCSPRPAWTPTPLIVGELLLLFANTLLTRVQPLILIIWWHYYLSPWIPAPSFLRLLYPTPYITHHRPPPCLWIPSHTSSGLWQSISGCPLMWIPSWLDSSSHNLCQDACNMDTFLTLFGWHCTMGLSYCFHDLVKTSFPIPQATLTHGCSPYSILNHLSTWISPHRYRYPQYLTLKCSFYMSWSSPWLQQSVLEMTQSMFSNHCELKLKFNI